MSRSRAKTKSLKAGGRRQSNKKDKSAANRNFRRSSKIKLEMGEEDLPKKMRETSDSWDFASDGLAIYDKNLPEKFMRK